MQTGSTAVALRAEGIRVIKSFLNHLRKGQHTGFRLFCTLKLNVYLPSSPSVKHTHTHTECVRTGMNKMLQCLRAMSNSRPGPTHSHTLVLQQIKSALKFVFKNRLLKYASIQFAGSKKQYTPRGRLACLKGKQSIPVLSVSHPSSCYGTSFTMSQKSIFKEI